MRRLVLGSVLFSALAALLIGWLMAAGPLLGADASLCRGTTANGRLEHGCRLRRSGATFEAYSSLGVSLGRTYVHCTVARVVEAAYARLAEKHPDLRFVYGETGFAEGGPFKPHKTHQNGLSVDFFVPVRDSQGKSVPLGTSALNKWGYDIEFDARGRYEDLRIDFDAIALHLAALDEAAKREAAADPEALAGVEKAEKEHSSVAQPFLGPSRRALPCRLRHPLHATLSHCSDLPAGNPAASGCLLFQRPRPSGACLRFLLCGTFFL